jgi:DNA-binding IclR family transcriptional regulator
MSTTPFDYNASPMTSQLKTTPKPRATRHVPAVTRAIAILRYLAKTKEPIGVVPLARALKLIPSTCLHIIRILSDEGLVAFNQQTKRYTLGPGVLSFASAYSLRNPFVQLVRAHLEQLSRSQNCAFAAVEESGPDHYIVVAVADVNAGLSVRLSPGTRFPALVSATGQCFAAFSNLTAPQLRERFEKLRWDNPPTFPSWLKQVQRARALGYAVDVGNYILGISIVAVPVFNDSGAILGCVAAVGLREQFVRDRLDSLIAGMRDVARQINRELGQDPFFDPRHIDALPEHRPARKARRTQSADKS